MDRQARHTRKSKSRRRDGFRGHVAAEPESGLIADCEMTMATGPGSTDAENGVKMAGRDRFRRTGPQAAADPAQTTASHAHHTSRDGGRAGRGGTCGAGAAGHGVDDAEQAADGQHTAGGQRAGDVRRLGVRLRPGPR